MDKAIKVLELEVAYIKDDGDEPCEEEKKRRAIQIRLLERLIRMLKHLNTDEEGVSRVNRLSQLTISDCSSVDRATAF